MSDAWVYCLHLPPLLPSVLKSPNLENNIWMADCSLGTWGRSHPGFSHVEVGLPPFLCVVWNKHRGIESVWYSLTQPALLLLFPSRVLEAWDFKTKNQKLKQVNKKCQKCAFCYFSIIMICRDPMTLNLCVEKVIASVNQIHKIWLPVTLRDVCLIPNGQ